MRRSPRSNLALEATSVAPSPGHDNLLAAKIDPLFVSIVDPAAHAPGCAVGVFRAGQILFSKGYGYANLEHDIPITPRTTFEIGSMSKQFTATAILLLAQDGKLSLDDDVRGYIAELPDYGHTITLRHLLHHTGGLREYDALLSLSGWDTVDVATEEEALRLIALQKGENFPPGTEWSYSNTGYFLLSQVVNRVSGKSLAVFSKERIFEPLGMKDTTILDDHARVVPRRATGYSPRESGGFQINMSAREMTGEGNVQSTIEDLARWDLNFYDPKVGGRAWLETMRTPGKLDDGTVLTYAMGLVLRRVEGRAVEEHAGGWAGYLSDGLRYPVEQLSVTCLCNRDDVSPYTLAQDVANALLPAPPADVPTRQSAAPATRHDPTAIIGTYLEPEGLGVRTLGSKGGNLTMRAGLPADPGPPPMEMAWVDARSFDVAGAASRWTFEPPEGNAPARATRVSPGEKTRVFSRFEPPTLDAAKLASYAGRYESAEMTHDFEVALVDGKLLAGPWGKQHLAARLTPLTPDAFAGDGSFGLVFGRDAKGEIASMVVVMDGHRAVSWMKR